MAIPAAAQDPYPMLMSLSPVAAQVGQTTEHTVYARYNLDGTSEVIVSGEGVRGEVVPPEKKPAKDGKPPQVTSLKLRFHVTAAAMPGVRDFRLVTPRGVSTLGQLVVARDPIVAEAKKNDTPEDAQPVSLPATICGTIEKAEDLDFYRFDVKAGETLCFDVRCMRLQDKIHDLQQHADPIITIRNPVGSTVAASDNRHAADPLLSHTFTHSGQHLLEVRDVRYQGKREWVYSIEIHQRPVVAAVHPLAIPAGTATQVAPIGLQLGEQRFTSLELPKDAGTGERQVLLPWRDGMAGPVSVYVTEHPQPIEQPGENGDAEHAQAIELPGGVSGRLEQASDIDCYSFAAKKGQQITVESFAHRLGSAMDPQIRLLDDTGKQLALNDDFRLGQRLVPDAMMENVTIPADGRYIVEIRDLHSRGGAGFVYYLKLSEAKPHFELYLDTDKTQIAPGAAGVIYVRSVRKNGYQGPIALAVEGLPPGVTATCGTILPVIEQDGDIGRLTSRGGAMIDGCILLQAAADASLQAAANIIVRGQGGYADQQDKQQAVSDVADVYQETYQPGGGRGHWPVGMHTVAIAEPGDIQEVTLSETDIKLAPGESKEIKVQIERSDAYDKNVTLDVIYKHLNRVYGDTLPRGVTLESSGSKTLLSGKENEGSIILKAAKDAPPANRQLVPVMANVSLNFVMKATFAGPPLYVTVQVK